MLILYIYIYILDPVQFRVRVLSAPSRTGGESVKSVDGGDGAAQYIAAVVPQRCRSNNGNIFLAPVGYIR